MTKEQQLEKFYEEYRARFAPEPLVCGYGNPDGGIVLVGEAPGREEIVQGKPFVGQAGKNLTAFLQEVAVSREDLFITNAMKCRLWKYSEKTGRPVNRPATKEDILQYREGLLQELEILQPEWIVTLGNVPLRAILGEDIPISQVHGVPKQVQVGNWNCHLFPLYHPASVLYRRELAQVYRTDLQTFRDLLA